jgi:hypothetical protein
VCGAVAVAQSGPEFDAQRSAGERRQSA